MLKVKFKKVHHNFQSLIKGSNNAACFDASVADIKFDESGIVTIDLGFQTEIPDGYKGIIVPRSNITKYGYAMLNSPGQVDSDYRGNWIVKFQRVRQDAINFPYKVGERCCQIYFEKVIDVEFEEVKDLLSTDRGEGGFGSTGK